MKSSLFLSQTLILIAITILGCRQDQSIHGENANDQVRLQVVIKGEDLGLVQSGKAFMEEQEGIQDIQGRSPNIQSATGTFTAFSGNIYDFAAVQNPGGIHGEVTIESLTRGTITAEALCVSTSGGEATAGLLLTSVEFPTEELSAGDIVYLKLKDNGEGANAGPDETSAQIIIFFNWELLFPTPEEFVSFFSCQHIEFIYENAFNQPDPFGAYQPVVEGNVQVR